ncbi:hypothetical protein BS50DRAFT_580500 [Corynespora cassiicola Philippines]|uniref:SnoaL-like domain-containing protein n=1 Tax=Corynespora cassiicola Philippines TaxID=1448308 RepID=A0A2T2MZU7_CORCC|nr:hypothetical protein BS50DRAFT_580500 [Corynespora cassiicola Philippines]
MRLLTLIAKLMSALDSFRPLVNPEPSHSDVCIGSDLKECLTNIDTKPRPNLHAQKETARAMIDAYNSWDIDSILAYRTPECQHQILPSSMGRAAKSNDEYRAYLHMIMPLYSNFTAVVLEEIHDAEAHTSIMHTSSTADTDIGQYTNEYVLILSFTEDGKQVTKFDEFVDSAYTEGFVAALANRKPT